LGEGYQVANESFGYTNSGECREERRFFVIFQLVIDVLHLDTNKDAICYKTVYNQKDVELIKKILLIFSHSLSYGPDMYIFFLEKYS
jgi:hypothetical protein